MGSPRLDLYLKELFIYLRQFEQKIYIAWASHVISYKNWQLKLFVFLSKIVLYKNYLRRICLCNSKLLVRVF